MEKYNKDECMELLRDSADARYFRTELLVMSALFTVYALISLTGLAESVVMFVGFLLFGFAGFGIFLVLDGVRLWRLYRNWERYEYLPGRVDKEIATFDYRRDCTALQVICQRRDGTGVVANTRNIFRQKSVWLDGWPIATDYANSEVLVAYDGKAERAIILKRTYRKK